VGRFLAAETYPLGKLFRGEVRVDERGPTRAPGGRPEDNRGAEGPLVAIVVGSDSDLPLMKEAYDLLASWGIGCRVLVASAHRTPDAVASFARSAGERGVDVIIACAGMAAHLPGVIAAHTTVPVIGVPRAVGSLGGLDALLSVVQMPPGVPVACVGLDAARNAALLAVAILAVKYEDLRERLQRFRQEQAEAVREKNARVAELGMAGP